MPKRKKSRKIKGEQEFILMALLAGGLNKEQIGDKFNVLGAQFGAPPWHTERAKHQDFLNRLDNGIQDLIQKGLIFEKEGVYHLTQEGEAEASELHAGLLKAGLKFKQFFSSGETASKFSVFINAVLSALKLGVGFLVNSMGLIADGLDNLVDVFSSVVVFFGIKSDLPDLILSPLYSITPEIEASAAQKPTFSWWLHALLSGVISQAT